MSKSYFEPHRVELYRAGEGLAMVEYITLKTIITPIGFEWIGWSEVSHHQLTSAYVGSSLPLVSPDPPTSILRKPSSGLVLGSSFSAKIIAIYYFVSVTPACLNVHFMSRI